MNKKSFDNINDSSPLYYQLAQKLREKITAGEFKPGKAMPTEPELCKQYGVSRITIRQAVEILENAGLVERQQGRGTYVIEVGRSHFGWNIGRVEDLVFLGETTRLELTSKRKIKANKTIASDLELAQKTSVYFIKGVRYTGDPTKALYNAYTNEAIGRQIEIKPIESQLLFLEVERIAKEPIKSAKQFIYATSANKKIAEEINVQPGSPVLVTKRIYRNMNKIPLLVAITYFPGEHYQSVSVLERQL